MKTLRRRRGATLGLIAVCVLVLAVLGAGFFFLIRIMGGGREIANASDAGALNLAKQALLDPAKSLTAFGNPDIATNFAVYGDPGTQVSLLNYNRLVVHAALVALNARAEGTAQAAQNAKRVHTALNEVAQFLRQGLESEEKMGAHFTNLANANNIKMLGGNSISLRQYDVSYMKRGGASNISIDSSVLQAAGAQGQLPVSAGLNVASNGHPFLAGYSPFTVTVSGGDKLTFCAVPVCPNDRPHLVRYGDFESLKSDDFAVATGLPEETLPPNSFQAAGQSREEKSKTMAGAVAAAIVGCHDRIYSATMQYGYLIVKNGPSAPGPKGPIGMKEKDVFCHALAATGIHSTGIDADDFFCEGGIAFTCKAEDMDFVNERFAAQTQLPVFDNCNNFVDMWQAMNELKTTNPTDYNKLIQQNIPNRAKSVSKIFHRDGTPITESDLALITKKANLWCYWSSYGDGGLNEEKCTALLPAFKKAFGQFGSTDNSPNLNSGEGFTAVEQLKVDVMSARYKSQNDCKACLNVEKPPKTGLKWFDHNKSYPAPTNPYNFGVSKTPFDYLDEIDKVQGGSTASEIVDQMLKRCQQIRPGTSRDDLVAVLKSTKLKLGDTFYIYLDGGKFAMKGSPPPWAVASSVADGAVEEKKSVYQVVGKMVDTCSFPINGSLSLQVTTKLPPDDPNTDGFFPGWNFRVAPEIECYDAALWTPSSGFEQLLGTLEFYNSCASGGKFCQPN